MLRLSEYSILRVMRGADKLMKLRVGTIWEDAEGGSKLTRLVAKIPHELKCLMVQLEFLLMTSHDCLSDISRARTKSEVAFFAICAIGSL